MSNIKELAEKSAKKEAEDRRAYQYFYEQQKMQLEIDKARYERNMKKLEKDNRKYRLRLRKLFKDNNIPHWEESIIVIEKEGQTHVYSRVNWFAPISIRENCRKIITAFMKSIGKELVLDDDGNPTNDIEWHFENPRTDYHFILNALDKHGYLKED